MRTSISMTPVAKPVEPQLACIVMPAGTGKTWLVSEGLPSFIREADDICAPRETPTLDKLRTVAYETGNWQGYDHEYASILRSRVGLETIILVSSEDLASALSAEVLGVFVVPRHIWERQLINRGDQVPQFSSNYRKAVESPMCKVFDTHKALKAAVLKVSDTWFLSPHRMKDIENYTEHLRSLFPGQ